MKMVCSLMTFEMAVVVAEKLTMYQAPTFGTFFVACVLSEVAEVGSRLLMLLGVAAMEAKIAAPAATPAPEQVVELAPAKLESPEAPAALEPLPLAREATPQGGGSAPPIPPQPTPSVVGNVRGLLDVPVQPNTAALVESQSVGKTLRRNSMLVGSFVVSHGMGVKEKAVTRDLLERVIRTTEIVQYVEQQSELAAHCALCAGHFWVGLLAWALDNHGNPGGAVSILEAFPALGANYHIDQATGEAVHAEFGAVPWISLGRGVLGITLALVGDFVCFLAEERVHVDSARLVFLKAGCETRGKRLLYLFAQLGGLGACAFGITVSRQIAH
jgi:hypothetical protein